MTGIVFDIQKFCVHDGPGIRTTVFLKGCMMSCLWCHNPESLQQKIQLSYDNEKCLSCKACSQCPNEVHVFEEQNHTVNFKNCKACGKCIELCPVNALKLIGKEMTVDEIMSQVLKDKKYYDSSSGGVTFSGGESTMQFDFLLELLKASKANGISTAIETNGIIPRERLEQLVELVDIFLFDFKATNETDHKNFTNVDKSIVLSSLEFLDSRSANIILRCPIIPNYNDNKEHFDAIKSLRNKYNSINSVDIMAYHDIGRHKWEQVGLDYKLKDVKSATPQEKERWEQLIK